MIAATAKLYRDWQAAHRAQGCTKAEFLRARGLPEKMLADLEAGRKHVEAGEKRNRDQSSEPVNPS